MPPVTQAWSYIAGEKRVNRVRAFAHPRTETLYLEYREPDPQRPGKTRKARTALGHRDQERGKQQAEELALQLRQGAPPRVEWMMQELFDRYLAEITPTQTPARQSEHRRWATGICAFTGPTRLVSSLTNADARRFVAGRQVQGDRRAHCEGRPIGTRGIQQEIGWWRGVLRWAVGEGLCTGNPLEGFRVVAKVSPQRPRVSEERYQALVAVADQVGGQIPSLFHVALVVAHETGHRGKSLRFLRGSDLDLEEARIRWRGESDKGGHEHWTPLTEDAVQILQARRRIAPWIGEGWILPSSRRPGHPIERTALRRWWTKAVHLAGLDKIAREGFHSLRRKFATDLKDVPLVDLADLGGWRSTQTITTCYQQPDDATMRQALQQRKAR